MSKDFGTSSVEAFFPKARTKELVVQNVENELLVYDLSKEKAHHLNDSSSRIWRLCDGKTTVDEIALQIAAQTRSQIESDFVLLALDELRKAGLLEGVDDLTELSQISRRKVLFRYALPTIALPIVLSLIAPPAVMAQSCAPGLGGIGAPCTSTPQCCPGLTCNLPGGPVGGICG